MLPDVILAGAMYAGKSTLAQGLVDRLGYSLVSARGVLQEKAARRLGTRREFQKAGAELEKETSGRWLASAVAEHAAEVRGPVVVDAARTVRQVEAIREVVGGDAALVFLYASENAVARRFEDASGEGGLVEPAFLREAMDDDIERGVENLRTGADLVIDSTRCDVKEVLAVTETWLRHRRAS